MTRTAPECRDARRGGFISCTLWVFFGILIKTGGRKNDSKMCIRDSSYYLPLLRAGVRIYEFTPGFLHAKCYVSDEDVYKRQRRVLPRLP